jgi:hypothetical protein
MQVVHDWRITEHCGDQQVNVVIGRQGRAQTTDQDKSGNKAQMIGKHNGFPLLVFLPLYVYNG